LTDGIVGRAEVYIPLDINRSPFNVGISIEIDAFRADRIELLTTKHQLNWTNPEIDRLMELIGGHPFLVRLVMFEAASKSIDLTAAIATASSPNGIFDPLSPLADRKHPHEPARLTCGDE
jgi:hypothetical protein